MTYAERLAEFQRVTGHKPGEMNKSRVVHRTTVATQVDHDGDGREETGVVSLEPPYQSSGPGRCNRFTRAAALGSAESCQCMHGVSQHGRAGCAGLNGRHMCHCKWDGRKLISTKPCVLVDGHEGPHEP